MRRLINFIRAKYKCVICGFETNNEDEFERHITNINLYI
jgi:DNA-directed RNA polymerase subunit RPC12/RpoP